MSQYALYPCDFETYRVVCDLINILDWPNCEQKQKSLKKTQWKAKVAQMTGRHFGHPLYEYYVYDISYIQCFRGKPQVELWPLCSSSGQEVQRVSVITDLPALLRDNNAECMKRVVPKVRVSTSEHFSHSLTHFWPTRTSLITDRYHFIPVQG